MSVTREAFVLVSVTDGRIRDLNDAAAHLLGAAKDQLQGQPFANEFKDRGRAEFVQNILALALSEMDAEVTIQTKRTRSEITITPISFSRWRRADADLPAGIRNNRRACQ